MIIKDSVKRNYFKPITVTFVNEDEWMYFCAMMSCCETIPEAMEFINVSKFKTVHNSMRRNLVDYNPKLPTKGWEYCKGGV